MAPPALTMQQDSDSESSEDLQRFREATWEVAPAPDTVAGATEKASTKNSSSCGASLPSARFKADEHEQDGNELQTTPEFRTHVAKKLGAMLDSYICVLRDGTHQPSVAKEGADSEEDGFRLFFSSVPGCCEDVTPIPQKKRQLPSSSSDSDEEWQRCQEAAISGTDILKHSAIPVPQLVPATATGEGAAGDQGKKKKRKKKKKKAKVDGANGTVLVQGAAVTQVQQGCNPQDGGALDSGNLKRKKRKKKRKPAGPVSKEEVTGNASDVS